MIANSILTGSMCALIAAGGNETQEPAWGNIKIVEEENYYTVSLENSAISVQYDMHPRHAKKENQEVYIVSFVVKESGVNLGDWLDAAAGRYLLKKAKAVHDGLDRKTVRMEWETKHEGKICIEEVSIFPDSPVMRIDYFTTCVNIVDIGFKGTFGTYEVYGAEEWLELRRTVTDPEITNHENEHHRLVDELYPVYPNPFIDTPDWKGLAPAPLNYNGWMIMGIYNEESGIGYGRVVPYAEISYMKFLWGHGFEFFPFWRNSPSPKLPFTTYFFPVTEGAEEIISRGKAIAGLDHPCLR
ncbi:hypothetical protein ACFL6S_01685 [Candidatus Poribacteria bacterium]